jgi:FMN-dependent NADH-azoreductase
MPTLLHIDSSPMGEVSLSRQLTKEFVERWRAANPQSKVISRDLTTISIPVVDAAWIYANYTPKEMRTQQQHDVLSLSTQFTTELLEANEYVIGVPMHNRGPSASFKLWVDQIVRFGETITITPSGPRGTLGGKRVTLVIAAGASYSPGSSNAAFNYLEPWLRSLFAYLGVKDMQCVFADGAVKVRNGSVDREAFLAPHIDAIEALFAEPCLQDPGM